MKRFISAGALAGALALVPALAPAALACGDKTSAPSKAVPADAAKVVLTVEGMSCGSCANSIRNALLALAGVYEAEVSFEAGQATVRYDAKTVKVESISGAIDKAGYKVAKVVTPS
ncbi:MAG: heavy-metal-associated domain-containing protein [Deltaproteobacteria bacterium]|nr:heavy-metal-associated domain-containing protein [Deltaproteobacteria bacterium]